MEICVTRPVYAPTREHNFVATVVDYEDETPIGYGVTEKAALMELLEGLDHTDKAFPHVLAKLAEIAANDHMTYLQRVWGSDTRLARSAMADRDFLYGFEYACEVLGVRF